MIQPFLVFSDIGLLVLRIVFAAILLAHGFPKIKNLKATAVNFGNMGFKPGIFWGPLIAILEFVGGLAILTGFLVQPLGILYIIEFIVASIKKMQWGKKFVDGYEFDFLLIGAALVLATIGAGSWSLDSFFRIILY